MKKLKINQFGFGAIEVLLLILVLAVIGFGGYYVWHNQHKATPVSTTTTTNPTTTKPSSTTTPKALSDSWLEYKAPHYSIKFADGWVITKKQGDGSGLYAADNNDLTYKAGQIAVVKDYTASGPSEFTYGLYIDYSDASANLGKCSAGTGVKLAFKTDSGNEVYKITDVGGSSTASGNLSKGDKYYGYCVQLGTSSLDLGYTVASGSKDNSSTVELVLRTVKSS